MRNDDYYTEYTNQELIDRIFELEDANSNLRDEVTDLRNQLDDHMGERDRLEEAAELMVTSGRIHNTPKAKLDWIEGR